jgi:hypothetical protein
MGELHSHRVLDVTERKLCPLSPWRGAFSTCGWRRRSPDTEGSCEYGMNAKYPRGLRHLFNNRTDRQTDMDRSISCSSLTLERENLKKEGVRVPLRMVYKPEDDTFGLYRLRFRDEPG